MSKRIAFLGGGNMAEALLMGLAAQPESGLRGALVIEPVEARRAELIERFKEFELRAVAKADALLNEVDLLILAVKPQIMERALAPCREHLSGAPLIISIAAGIKTSTLETMIGGKAPKVVRAMPNTPALVGEGATAIAAGQHTLAEDLDRAEQIFQSVGRVVRVTEDLLDAVTGLSGSGPAYVFQFIEALADGGVKNGLPRAEALALAAQTVKGAASLLLETGEHPGVLKDRVTSPGGTTIAGIAALERGRLRGTVIDAVTEATKRSKELG